MRIESRPALALLALTLTATALFAQRSGPGPERRTMEPRPMNPPPSSASPRPTDATRPFTPGTSREGGARDVQRSRPSLPPGMASVDRPRSMRLPTSNRILFPPAMPRCRFWPDSDYWGTRDIFKEIQHMARRGFIPVTPAGDAGEIVGESYFPAGWRAYAFVVPAKEKLHVRLHHTNEGWFRLAMVDRWGQLRPGMLQNLIPTGNPEVSYTNPVDQANIVYVIVDDPGWMATKSNPFTINVDRSWDPLKATTPQLPPVLGIWAQAKVEVKEPPAEPVPPKETPAL